MMNGVMEAIMIFRNYRFSDKFSQNCPDLCPLSNINHGADDLKKERTYLFYNLKMIFIGRTCTCDILGFVEEENTGITRSTGCDY